MAITVGDLVANPHLMLRGHAGIAGYGREVTWAHTSDLPEPWEWVSNGELLMSNGMSFPADAAAQVSTLRRLHERGVSAIAIGADMYCPPLTSALSAEADRLAFPVLWIRYPLPFVSIARTVAAATLPEQSERLFRTSRIYDAIRRTAGSGVDRSATAGAIGSVLDCDITVCDPYTGEAYFPQDRCPAPEITAAIRPALSGSAGTVTRTQDGRAVFVVPVPTHRNAIMVAVSRGPTMPDPHLLQHAATVIALELSHVHLTLEGSRRAGAELVAHLLDGRIRTGAATRELRSRGLHLAGAVLLAARSDDKQRVLDLHLVLWGHRIPHALVVRSDTAYLIVPDNDGWEEPIRAGLGDSASIGVSRPLGEVGRVPDAGREATWALSTAQREGLPLARYGDARPILGPRDVADARALVEHHLGALVRYDGDHGSDLLRTLETYLGLERSWTKTAEALQVHRQTVRYRIGKIEELTGSDLSATADLAHMWLALEARRTWNA